MQQFKLSEATAARRYFYLHLVDATDGITPETGEAAGQPQISKNGAAFGNTTATLTAIGSGAYYVALTVTELNALGFIMVRYKSAATAEFQGLGQVVAFDPFAAAGLGLTNLDAAISSRSSHAAADVWAVGTRTLTSFGTLVADIWAYATRVLTAGTNIVLAKGVGLTGLNDLSAAQVNAEADTALADYDPPTDTEMLAAFAALNDITVAAVWAHVVEGSETAVGFLRLMLAALAGKATVTAGTQSKFRDIADGKDRLVVDHDDVGNRTAVTRDSS